MNLYNSFIQLPPERWKYYSEAPGMDFNTFSHDSAYRFIRGTYKKGAKDRIFDVGFKKDFVNKGKHEHTVALYFLGCLFREIIDDNLRKHLLSHIPNVNDWYDFRYTWFLTCLYHDTAAVIEKSEWSRKCSSDIDFYLGKYDVQYNVFEHDWDNPKAKPYTYPESLVKKYFKYRVEHCHSIDHGIIAGYLLYDKLVKNNNDAWQQHSKLYPYANYKDFYYKGLHWHIDHMPHFAIVADSIIAHNIWLSSDAALYKQYGLDTLIIPINKKDYGKLTINENPLVFFLDLFDTIEPVKFFSCVQPKVVLKSIDAERLNEQNEIVISMRTELLKFDSWYSIIEKMKDWLSIRVDTVQNEVKVRIKYDK